LQPSSLLSIQVASARNPVVPFAPSPEFNPVEYQGRDPKRRMRKRPISKSEKELGISARLVLKENQMNPARIKSCFDSKITKYVTAP
jgi:hypothetical protein